MAELARAGMAVGLAGLFIEAHSGSGNMRNVMVHPRCRWLNWNRSSSR
ncbi:2-dehydro-3-deoxyphosphooctonate aldolase domain protein [Shigella dysenteriae 225-75]|nr:2-dehydro-3-deoxyphosphooctonate aldolase domain protein [Shigella dysenteriae 225-75]